MQGQRGWLPGAILFSRRNWSQVSPRSEGQGPARGKAAACACWLRPVHVVGRRAMGGAQEGTSSSRKKQGFGSQAEQQMWLCRLLRATLALL